MRGMAKALLLASATASGSSAAEPPGLVNAKLEVRTAAPSSLEREIRGLIAAKPGPLWLGYAVPAMGRHTMCCWSGDDNRGLAGCRLEREQGEGTFVGTGKKTVVLEGAARFRVLLRAEGGRIGRVHAFSEDCELDAGGLPFVWFEAVRAAESVAFLASLLEKGTGGAPLEKRAEDGALAALARTDDPAADEALERFLAQGESEHRRKQAAFWIGQTRRPKGLARLGQLVRTDPSPKFREHVVFALSQSGEQSAIERIVDVARHDEDGHVRGQALFWLAQVASRRAVPAIETALQDDPEVEVKKQAVFALSQLPRDEGVPMLIRLAKTHKTPEVRKQAMFWLGQSRDERALRFFEDVLKP